MKDVQIFPAFIDEECEKRCQFNCFWSVAFGEWEVLDSILVEKTQLKLQRRNIASDYLVCIYVERCDDC